MWLVDASAFVLAFRKPGRRLKPHEVEIKEAAKTIVRRINDEEKVGLTVVQLAEIANILERYMSLEKAFRSRDFSSMPQRRSIRSR